MIKNKVRPSTFKYIESEITHYNESVRELKDLREQIIHGSGSKDENVGGSRSGKPSEQTAERAIALVENRQVQQLERITAAIKDITDRLPPEKKRLIHLKYWARPQTLTWDGIAYEMNISRATVLRWRHEIIQAIAEIIGFR